MTVVSYQFSEVLIASPKPPWLHLSGAKVVSKGPDACTETLSLSAIRLIYGEYEGVTDGTRTRDLL